MKTANPVARNFRDLIAYQRARAAANTLFEPTKEFPKEERFELLSQIRRPARATRSMIASAWARRLYKAAFISKLDEDHRSLRLPRESADGAV